jgi:hypothetical protein
VKVADMLVHDLQFTNPIDLIGMEDKRLWLDQFGQVLSRLQEVEVSDKENARWGPIITVNRSINIGQIP